MISLNAPNVESTFEHELGHVIAAQTGEDPRNEIIANYFATILRSYGVFVAEGMC
jgi:hypothetical protein